MSWKGPQNNDGVYMFNDCEHHSLSIAHWQNSEKQKRVKHRPMYARFLQFSPFLLAHRCTFAAPIMFSRENGHHAKILKNSH